MHHVVPDKAGQALRFVVDASIFRGVRFRLNVSARENLISVYFEE